MGVDFEQSTLQLPPGIDVPAGELLRRGPELPSRRYELAFILADGTPWGRFGSVRVRSAASATDLDRHRTFLGTLLAWRKSQRGSNRCHLPCPVASAEGLRADAGFANRPNLRAIDPVLKPKAFYAISDVGR